MLARWHSRRRWGAAQQDQWSLGLSQEHFIGGADFERNGFTNEQGLPVDAIHQRVLGGDDAAGEILTALRGIVGENDCIALGKHGVERIIGDKRQIGCLCADRLHVFDRAEDFFAQAFEWRGGRKKQLLGSGPHEMKCIVEWELISRKDQLDAFRFAGEIRLQGKQRTRFEGD